MISDSLQFEEYRVATDEISDHRPVIAVVRYQPAGEK
jgi:endonuclease/exonuclease/phosphatase (EEP) superfamily protein YafD